MILVNMKNNYEFFAILPYNIFGLFEQNLLSCQKKQP